MYKSVALVLIFAYIVSAAQIDGSNEDVKTVELQSKIDDLLAKVEKVVNNALGTVRKELAVAENAVKNAATAADNVTKKMLDRVLQTFQKGLDAIKTKAKNAGVNIDECLGADEKALLNLPTKAANEAIGCVAGLVLKVTSSVDDALQKIQKIADDVLESKKSLSQCLKNKISVTCLAKLALKLGKDVTVLPAEIIKDGSVVVALADAVEEEITACGTYAVSSCETQGTALLAKISACVSKKIINK